MDLIIELLLLLLTLINLLFFNYKIIYTAGISTLFVIKKKLYITTKGCYTRNASHSRHEVPQEPLVPPEHLRCDVKYIQSNLYYGKSFSNFSFTCTNYPRFIVQNRLPN